MADQGAGLDLAAIKARAEARTAPYVGIADWVRDVAASADDVPPLVAEVERLQAIEQAAWTMVRTPTFDVLVKLKTALAAGGVS